jgi:hypothetical protein
MIWFMAACSTVPAKKIRPAQLVTPCDFELASSGSEDPLVQLKLVSSLYDHKCFSEVVILGREIRDHSRDKVYNIFAETLEFFLPAGSTTEYVLESYERTYLSFLMAASYEHLGQREDSSVEIRRAYDEGKAQIYNYGEDLVNLVLQAVLWENSNEPLNARPFWLKVQRRSEEAKLQDFASQRISALDQRQSRSGRWRIYSYGHFPQLDWHMNFESKDSGYYEIKQKHAFHKSCASEHSLFISTQDWARKVAIRSRMDYHPLLNLKSWTRLPIGVTLGGTAAVAGIGVGVGGCGAGIYLASAGHGSGDIAGQLCEGSFNLGKEIFNKSGAITNYVLEPDLRNWQQVPEGFYITDQDISPKETCKVGGYLEFVSRLKPLIVE